MVRVALVLRNVAYLNLKGRHRIKSAESLSSKMNLRIKSRNSQDRGTKSMPGCEPRKVPSILWWPSRSRDEMNRVEHLKILTLYADTRERTLTILYFSDRCIKSNDVKNKVVGFIYCWVGAWLSLFSERKKILINKTSLIVISVLHLIQNQQVTAVNIVNREDKTKGDE